MFFPVNVIGNYSFESVTFCDALEPHCTMRHTLCQSGAKNSSSAFTVKLLSDIAQVMELSSDFISLSVNGSVIILALPSS